MDDGSWERWSIRAVVNGRNKLDPDDTSPSMDVKVTAEKMLNVTVTKSFLSLLNKVSEVCHVYLWWNRVKRRFRSSSNGTIVIVNQFLLLLIHIYSSLRVVYKLAKFIFV